MPPLIQSAEHGQPKRGVSGEELVQAPQRYAPLPILVASYNTYGANIVPHTTTSFTRIKTGGGCGVGEKVNFPDTISLKKILLTF